MEPVGTVKMICGTSVIVVLCPCGQRMYSEMFDNGKPVSVWCAKCHGMKLGYWQPEAGPAAKHRMDREYHGEYGPDR